MKSKYTWWSFICTTVLAVAVKLLQILNIQLPYISNFMTYVAILPVLLGFIVNFVIVVADRKISPVYIIKRNLPAAVFAVLTAAFVASYSVLTLVNMFMDYTDNDYMKYFISILGLFAAFAIVFIALAHYQGKNYMPSISGYLLAIPLWATLFVVNIFMNSRTHSVLEINPLPLFLMIFAMMYFLNLSMLIATVDGKKPTKGCYLYGFPLASLCILYGVESVNDVITSGFSYTNNVFALALLSLAVYIMIFNYEISKNSKTVDQQKVVFDVINEDSYDLQELDPVRDEFIVGDATEEDEVIHQVGDFSDFITDVDNILRDEPNVKVEDPLMVSSDSNYNNDAIYVSKYFAEEFENNIRVNEDNLTEDK